MPCHANCDLRDLLLAKEEKTSRLQQVKCWVDALYRQEPHRRNEIIAKKSIVTNQIVQALAEGSHQNLREYIVILEKDESKFQKS